MRKISSQATLATGLLSLVETSSAIYRTTVLPVGKVKGGRRALLQKSAFIAAAVSALFLWPHAAITAHAEEAYISAFQEVLPTWPLLEFGLLFTGVFLAALVTLLAMAKVRVTNDTADRIPLRRLLQVLLPYAGVSIALAISRGSQWPRYILPLIPATTVVLYKLYGEVTNEARFPVQTVAVLAIYIGLVVTVIHDDYAKRIAGLGLLTQYTAHGLPRSQLEAGMDMDGWFEVSTGNNINEPRVRVPASSYQVRSLPATYRDCHTYFLPYSLNVHPVFRITQKRDELCDAGAPLFQSTAKVWAGRPKPYFLYRLRPEQQIQ